MKFKRPLVLVLVLALAMSAVTGGTIAWFTDEVTSANNIIKSGTLDVEMAWSNEKDGTYADASKGSIFTHQLWEPGYTEVKYVKIENKGNLAFKYQLNVIPTVPKNATDPYLADVIDVYYKVIDSDSTFADPQSFADVKNSWTNAGNITELMNVADSAVHGAMLDDQKELVIALALHMQETAGNEYQNLSVGDGFTVNLLATQYTHEEDSFGSDYDAESTYPADITSNGEQNLMNLLANAPENEALYIRLTNDVTYVTGNGGNMDNITPASSVVIDGQGKYTITFTGAGTKAVGDPEAPITLKNLTVVDQSKSYAEESWEYGYLEFDGVTTFENVNFVNAISMGGVSGTFKNCTFNSNKDSEYSVWVSNGTAAFADCTFTGPRGLKTHEAYGSEVKSITVDNCVFQNLTKKPGVAIGTMNPDTKITIKNSKFIDCQAGDQNLYIYETDTNVNNFEFVLENNEIVQSLTSGADINAALKAGNDTIALKAGNYTFPSSESFDGNETIICEEGTVFTGNSKLNINGATVIGATFSNPSGTAVDQTINGTFKDCTFEGSNGLRWCYAGETVVFENCVFSGDVYGAHFDGGANDVLFKNCTFSGFNAFAGTISDLKFEGCTFVANGKSGYNGVNCWGKTAFKDCTFVFDGSVANEWVDNASSETMIVENCYVSDGTTTTLLVEGNPYIFSRNDTPIEYK